MSMSVVGWYSYHPIFQCCKSDCRTEYCSNLQSLSLDRSQVMECFCQFRHDYSYHPISLDMMKLHELLVHLIQSRRKTHRKLATVTLFTCLFFLGLHVKLPRFIERSHVWLSGSSPRPQLALLPSPHHWTKC